MPAASALAAAVAFLTRIPAGGKAFDVGAGAAVFPLVGAALGAAVGGTAYGLTRILPALVAAGLAVALGAVLTGALHLDGLADTADALGARSRETALAVYLWLRRCLAGRTVDTLGAAEKLAETAVVLAAAGLAGGARAGFWSAM